jgi:predicted nucleic-acid-binding protein
MRAIDTNILVRALVRDDATQSAKAALLLAGDDEFYIPVTVILELEWVLRSRYGLAPKIVAQAIARLAALKNIILAERTAVLSAATKASKGWDFTDALHHALSEGCDAFVTLDGDLAKRGARVESSAAKVTPPIIKL